MINRCQICNRLIPSNDANDKAGIMLASSARGAITMTNIALCNKCFDEKAEPALKNLYKAVKLEYSIPEMEDTATVHMGNPVKTNKDVLLGAFPKAPVDRNGLPFYDPCHFGLCKSGDYCDEHSCEDCRKEYWNKEYKGRCENE